MKSASTTARTEPTGLPERPINDVCAGVDWASADHAVAIVDDRGQQIARKTVAHTTAGLRSMVRFLGRHGAPAKSRSNVAMGLWSRRSWTPGSP
ncbi:hypothetical protein BH18ACT9_BH18ACT9_17880 [soil metagenome]